jgi:hypothetical protein
VCRQDSRAVGTPSRGVLLLPVPAAGTTAPAGKRPRFTATPAPPEDPPALEGRDTGRPDREGLGDVSDAPP